jgi:hypothetical protein
MPKRTQFPAGHPLAGITLTKNPGETGFTSSKPLPPEIAAVIEPLATRGQNGMKRGGKVCRGMGAAKRGGRYK